MKRICCYNLAYKPIQTIETSLRAEILTAIPSDDNIQLYVVSNPDALKTTKTFALIPTNDPMPGEEYRYISTIVSVSRVFHLFEIN